MFLTFQKSSSDLDACITLYLAFGNQILRFWTLMGLEHRWFNCIYPSQCQNLLPTLEIITHNFQNFQKIQNFGKKFQNLEFFPKFPKPQRGRQ